MRRRTQNKSRRIAQRVLAARERHVQRYLAPRGVRVL